MLIQASYINRAPVGYLPKGKEFSWEKFEKFQVTEVQQTDKHLGLVRMIFRRVHQS